MFDKGDIVYIRDVDGCIYEGEVLDIDETNDSYYVGYETDYYWKEIWTSFGSLLLALEAVHKNAVLIF